MYEQACKTGILDSDWQNKTLCGQTSNSKLSNLCSNACSLLTYYNQKLHISYFLLRFIF